MITKKIGLVGVGKMGYGIGYNILSKGYDLLVIGNKNREGINKLVEINATEVGTVSEMAEKCEIIITSLPSSVELYDVLFGGDGIENSNCNDILIIDTTTGDPILSKKFSERLSSKGVRYVDAPVTRGPKEAVEGRLNTILGGEDNTKGIAYEIVSLYSEFIISTEGVGSAHKLKLLNNALSMGVVAISAEIISAAEKLDINLESLRELVSHGGVNNGLLQGFLQWYLDDSKDSLDFSISNAEKDLRYFESLCAKSNYDTNIINSVHHLFSESIKSGLGDLTLPNIINSAR